MRLSYIIQNNDRDFFEKNNHFFLMKHMGSHVLEKRKITAKPVVLRCRRCTFNYILSEKYSRSQILSYLRQIKLPRFIVTSAWRVGGGGAVKISFACRRNGKQERWCLWYGRHLKVQQTIMAASRRSHYGAHNLCELAVNGGVKHRCYSAEQ
jgi:hypothetical protein